MKIVTEVIHRSFEDFEIDDTQLPKYFVKDHWAGTPTWYKLSAERIFYIKETDVYSGVGFEVYSRAFAGDIQISLHEIDIARALMPDGDKFSNEIREITAEEFEEAKERIFQQISDH